MSAPFEGFDGQTSPQPSGDQFWSRKGVDATAAPGNGSLPPGAKETPDFKTAKMPKPDPDFIKKVAG